MSIKIDALPQKYKLADRITWRQADHLEFVGKIEIDALPLTYKLANKQIRRHANLSDFVGKTALERYFRGQKLHIKEHHLNLSKIK